MDGESGIWHVLVGLFTLIGGGYYAWWVYLFCLPDESTLVSLEEQAEARVVEQATKSLGGDATLTEGLTTRSDTV